MRTAWKNRLALGFVLTAIVFAATHNIRAELPQAVGVWASLGTAPESRVGAAAVALTDGRTLIVGGSVNGTPTDSVVVFNPSVGSFSTIGHLLLARVGHTATLLDDGRVLIAGGTSGDLISSDLEVFNPSTGTSVIAGAMTQPRTGHAATKLADGKVFIAGGTGTNGVLQNAEIYDPSTGTPAPAALPMLSPRTGASATTLIDGRVLIAGGNSGTADLASAELFEPSSQTFAWATTALSVARSGHAAVLLPHNNSVLIAGGSSNGVAVRTTDLFVPAQFPDPYSYGMGTFAPTGSLITARSRATASPHIEGYAVAIGGGVADAEVYRFATIKTDKDDYAPGEHALITGSGWEPNSEVTLLFQEDPAVHDDYVLRVPTDSNGNVHWDQWSPDLHDVGVRFYLLATGLQSRAQTTFTDAQVQTVTVAPPTSVTVAAGATAAYGTVTVTLNGNNTNCTVTLGVGTVGGDTGLPVGVTPAFGNSPFTSSSNGTSSFSLATTGATPAGTYTFRVTATEGTDCQHQTTTNSDVLTLVVIANPTISKTFGAATIALNASTSLSFTITNPNTATTLTGIAFSDTLPAGLVVASPNGLSGTCGGTITATAGFSSISLSGATLAGGASCTFSVNVTGTTTGVKNNTTGNVSSTNGGTGNAASASVTVVDQAATLVVKKHVVNDNGGTKAASDFSLTVTGTNVQPNATFAGSEAGTTVTLSPGSYSIDEAAVSGYTKSIGANCSGTIAAGETKTCTITNDDQAATLVVKKHVINDNGGTKAAGDFSLTVTGTNVQPNATFAGSEAGTTVTLNAGSYSIDEAAVSGYTKSIGADCSGTIANGETKTCTITNDDQAATLVVKKHVVNDNGGPKAASDFSLTVTGTNVQPNATFAGSEAGTTVTLSPGSYSIDEAAVSGYTKSIGADCSGTIANGETKTCTITNDDQAATLVVKKHVVNDNGGPKSASDFSLTVTGTNVQPSATFAGSEAGTTVTLNSGNYSVDEAAVSGYTKSIGADCSGTIANGETKTCTITNDDQAATLVVKKHVVNDNGGPKSASDFSLTVTGTNVQPSATFAGSEAGTTVTLSPGNYSVDEAAVSGYTKSIGADCSGTIANGETKTCTITNDDQAATLVVKKHVVNDNGGPKSASDFSLTVTGTNVQPSATFAGSEAGTTVTLNSGNYSVDEAAVSGYTKSIGADCSGTIANGETKTCTITNDDQAATMLTMGPQAMEGDLKVAPGTTLSVGYDFTMPGNHSSATVQFVGAKVVFQASCMSGTQTNTITVPIANMSYTDPANSSAWYPSGDQHDPSVYQGSISVPDFCPSHGLVRLQTGGTFTTGVFSTDNSDKVNVRWHYSANGTAGSWSGTKSVVPR